MTVRESEPDTALSRSDAGERIAIVGGGIMGMSLALRLRERGLQVTLYEARPSTGGLACAQEIGGWTWDRFYHVILLSDSHTRDLLDKLGLADKLQWGTTRTGFFTDGKLYSMSNVLEFLRFPPLSLLSKFRLGCTIFLASRIRNWRKLEKTTSVAWLRRWSGRAVVERIWLPLLRSKLGENATIASAAFIWAIIARMYAARRSGLKQEMFGYVDGGYDVVLRKLQQKLDEHGVETLYEARVSSVTSQGEDIQVRCADDDVQYFDKVVLTTPTSLTAQLCEELTAEEKDRLNAVTYQGVICASLLMKQGLSDYYITNITDGAPFTGVIEMTALVDKKYFGGNALVYLPCYLTQESSYWEKNDEEIKQDFLTALEAMYPNFRRDHVLAFELARARQVLAVSTLDYSTNIMPGVTTSIPNVFLLNSAQIANGTLNVNETLAVVESGMRELSEYLEPASATIHQWAGR